MTKAKSSTPRRFSPGHADLAVDQYFERTIDLQHAGCREQIREAVHAIFGELRREQSSERTDIEILVGLLREANEMCRSAYAVAKRKGVDTNWPAFQARLNDTLARYHAALYREPVDPCRALCRECKSSGQCIKKDESHVRR